MIFPLKPPRLPKLPKLPRLPKFPKAILQSIQASREHPSLLRYSSPSESPQVSPQAPC